MRLDLIILTPDHQSRRYSLEENPVTLGRAHSNDLCYAEDASLSRRHLEFKPGSNGEWRSSELMGQSSGSISPMRSISMSIPEWCDLIMNEMPMVH